jgi:hypothetical protein
MFASLVMARASVSVSSAVSGRSSNFTSWPRMRTTGGAPTETMQIGCALIDNEPQQILHWRNGSARRRINSDRRGRRVRGSRRVFTEIEKCHESCE